MKVPFKTRGEKKRNRHKPAVRIESTACLTGK